MKRTNIIYWILTGLFALAMLFSSFQQVLNMPEAVKFVTNLGFPAYMTQFLGIAKVLGVVAILVPGFPRLKEWAYAGIFFDLIGALYGFYAKGTPMIQTLPMLVFFALLFGSYYYYHKRAKLKSGTRSASQVA